MTSADLTIPRVAGLLIMLILAASECCRAADMGADDPLIQALIGQDEAGRIHASQKLIEAGPTAVSALIVSMDKHPDERGKVVYETLFRLVQQPGTRGQQGQVANQLTHQLQPGYSIETRRRICRLLAYVGDTECVETLYRVLADEELGETVRQTLVQIPSRNATEALVGGLQLVVGDPLIALVNAIGERADRLAVPSVRLGAERGEGPLREASMAALARMADKAALESLRKATKADESGAVRALLDLGETLTNADMQAEAREAFREAAGRATIEMLDVCRIAHGLGRVGEVQDVRWLLDRIGEKDRWGTAWPRVRAVCWQAIGRIPGKEVTNIIADVMTRSTGQAKLDALDALAERGAAMTDTTAARIVELLTSDSDPPVKLAAIATIEKTAIISAVPALLAAIQGPANPLRHAAEKALIHAPGEAFTSRLIAAYRDAPEAKKGDILTLLGYRRSAEVIELLIEEVKSGNSQIRAAAAIGLGRSSDPKCEKTLLELLEPGSKETRKVAVDAYLKAARRKELADPAAAAPMYMKVFASATTSEQAARGLDGLSRTAGPEYLEFLPIATELMLDSATPESACRVAIRLAMQLPADREEEAHDIMRTAATIIPGDPLVPRIMEFLGKKGVTFNLPDQASFVTSWWLAGPLPVAENKKWDEHPLANTDIDPRFPATIGGKNYPWKLHHEANPRGIVELDKVFTDRKDQACYAYAELNLEMETDAVLRIGGDDRLLVWLNDQEVHKVSEPRDFEIDRDRVPVKLQKGVNKLLIRLFNRKGPWMFSVRLTTLDNMPAPFVQTSPPQSQPVSEPVE